MVLILLCPVNIKSLSLFLVLTTQCNNKDNVVYVRDVYLSIMVLWPMERIRFALTFDIILMVEPSILQYRLQKDQQMLKEVVDFLLIRSKFSTPACFGISLPSSGGCVCLISYSSNVLCYGRVRIMTRPVWPVVVEHCFSNISGTHNPLRMATICRNMSGKKIWNVLIKHPPLPWAFVGLFANDVWYCLLGSEVYQYCKLITNC
jgi:hypothetical protein